MYFLLYGPDTYSSQLKLNEIKEKFGQENMAEVNLNIVDGVEINNLDDINDICQPLPFLAKKRMVIIKNLLSGNKNKDLKDKIADYLERIPEHTVLIFYESDEFDEKLKLFKSLVKEKNTQRFELLIGPKLEKWIKNKVEKLGGKIEPDAVKFLAVSIGSDLWRMENEIKKLIIYKQSITITDVKKLIAPEIETNIFKLIDALGQKNLKKALIEVKNMQKKGENEIYILSMIVYQIRNLLLVKNILTNNKQLTNNQQSISKKLALHPFVIKKTISQAKNFTLEKLKNAYQKLVNFDIAIKTGRIEPENALNLLIVEIAKD